MGTHYEQLSAEECATTMLMVNEGKSLRAMARILRRSPSTIRREWRRYTPPADVPGLSPGQIAGALKMMWPDAPERGVSPDTIYSCLYALPRGALRQGTYRLPAQGPPCPPATLPGYGSTWATG